MMKTMKTVMKKVLILWNQKDETNNKTNLKNIKMKKITLKESELVDLIEKLVKENLEMVMDITLV